MAHRTIGGLFIVLLLSSFLLSSCSSSKDEGNATGDVGSPCKTINDCGDGLLCIEGLCTEPSDKDPSGGNSGSDEKKDDQGQPDGQGGNRIFLCIKKRQISTQGTAKQAKAAPQPGVIAGKPDNLLKCSKPS